MAAKVLDKFVDIPRWPGLLDDAARDFRLQGPPLHHGPRAQESRHRMFAQPPKAEVARCRWHFRFVPIPEVRPIWADWRF